MKKHWVIITFLFSIASYAQMRNIENADAINNFYHQLDLLEHKQIKKVNITHIGDSHIQADFFTGKMRTYFQDYFGNAGIGFSFPYKLAKTNNSNKRVKYSSNVSFVATRNIFAKTNMPVGLSAIAFESKMPNTAIKLTLTDFDCTSVKVLTPDSSDLYFATYGGVDFKKLVPKKTIKIHHVKSGESLYVIAKKYKVSISSIRKKNNIKKNFIRPKQKLKIPINTTEKGKINPTDFYKLSGLIVGQGYLQYTPNNTIIDELYLFSNNQAKTFSLSGFIFENNKRGVVYNAIGVNGAKCNDFNKFPEFFKQLSFLQSDLVIVSLGTNESFDNLSETLFIERFLTLITNLRKENPRTQILITTPPASLFKRKYKNTFIESYIAKIKENMYLYDYAVWDLYEALGGHDKINENYKNGLMAKDKVHYSKAGYDRQALLFFEEIKNYLH